MQKVIGVRFKKAGKIYHFGTGKIEIVEGDSVVVETSRGLECGEVVLGLREVEDHATVLPVKPILRKATAGDIARIEGNEKLEQEAYEICEKKIAEHKLPMKLIRVEYTFDISKIIFYFTADGRVDFRNLVKDLASVFRTRIELRQIGVRDEAKLMGGIGGCGRPICCATFLGDFEPVSIRMAKEQNLSLNPTKISGACGRLMCCLKYESECYHKNVPCERMRPPRKGSWAVTAEGEGKIVFVDRDKRLVALKLTNGRSLTTSWDDIVEKDEEA